jgi:hypothetical protein
MKKLFLVIVLTQFCITVIAQGLAVTPQKGNVFYIGVDNPFTVVSGTLGSDEILVKADKGEVFGSALFRTYRGYEPGYISIILFNKQTQMELGRSLFRVKPIPNPTATLANSTGGTISKATLMSQSALNTELLDFDFDVRFSVDSFTCQVSQITSCEQKKFVNTGGQFNKAILESLKNVKKNDIVMFDSIYVTGPDGSSRKLSPLAFIIND